jgi:hypothetical protein
MCGGWSVSTWIYLSPGSLGHMGFHNSATQFALTRQHLFYVCQKHEVVVTLMASDVRDFHLERSRSPEPLDETERPQNSVTWEEDKVSALPSRKFQSPKSSLRDGGIRSPHRNSTIESTASSVIPLPWEKQYVLSLGEHHFV